MPNSLGLLHDELTYLYGDIDWLLGNHTLFRFYCCGLPRSRFEAQRQRLILKLPGPVRLCRHPLLFDACEQANKQCPECEIEQKREYGFPFIALRTCLPFVNVCSVHGNPLRSVRKQLLLFDDYCQSAANKHQIERTMELAKLIEECVVTELVRMDTHKDDVIKLLRGTGWLQENGRLHADKFKKEFSAYFKGSFSDERLALLCTSPALLEGAIRKLLREDRALPPVFCVLFKMFAKNATHHVNPQSRRNVFAADGSLTRIVSVGEIDKAAMEQLLNIHGNLATTAKAIGISQSKLTSACKRLGIHRVWRGKKLDAELSAKIKDAFVAGKTECEIADMVGMSATSVYRELDTIPNIAGIRFQKKGEGHLADKALFEKLREENPHLNRNQLRDQYSNLWHRLYRREKAWLESKLPPPIKRTYKARSTPPQELINILDKAVTDAALICATNETHPVNSSVYRLRQLSGVSEHAFNRIADAGLIQKQGLPHDETNEKRLELAAARVATARKISTLAREARLRPSTVARLQDKSK